ncbi:hypothetical protein D9M71_229990 [compost metagenome]
MSEVKLTGEYHTDVNDLISQISALRKEIGLIVEAYNDTGLKLIETEQRLADAERRNALPADWDDQLFAEMERRFELSKQYHQDHLVNDDTQIGVEFAIEWITAALKPTESGASE